MKLSTTRVLVSGRSPQTLSRSSPRGTASPSRSISARSRPSLPGRELDGLPGGLHLEAIEADGDLAEAELPKPVLLLRSAVPAAAAQQGAGADQQLVELEGLGEIVVRSLLDAAYQVRGIVLRRQDQDRHVVPRGAGPASHLEPAHLREHQVENHQVEGRPARRPASRQRSDRLQRSPPGAPRPPG